MSSSYEELHDLVRSMLIIFVGRHDCLCMSQGDGCEGCHKRSRLEDYTTTYIATKKGRAMVQRSLAYQAKKMNNLKVIELTEFLDNLADVYPNLDNQPKF